MAAKLKALKELQSRKAELALKCKAKGEEISRQADYVTEHLGEIAIKSIIGNHLKKGFEVKTEVIRLIVADIIDAAVNIKKDPANIKEKIIDFAKKTGSGVMDILFK